MYLQARCTFCMDYITLSETEGNLKHALPGQGTRLPCEFGANPFSGSRDI